MKFTTYPSSTTTEFIITLPDMRTFGLTIQLEPNIEFLTEVFSEIVVFSATAH